MICGPVPCCSSINVEILIILITISASVELTQTRHLGRWTHRGKSHVGRHCSYTYKIWCGSVHALLRCRSKTTKMQKFPVNNENFISPFLCLPLIPKRGEDTSGTGIGPHAKCGLNRPAGCREIVDKKRTNKKNTVKLIPRPSL